jgi:peptidoglycan/LPS O-acetylase OafA/YrhL
MDNRALNLVRSIAALLVVLGHVRLFFFLDYADAPHNLVSAAAYSVTSLGGAAVIVFFVLSGYFVGGSVLKGMRRGTFSWATYASKRLTRLWLVLLPALALTFLLDHIGHWLAPAADMQSNPGAYAGMPTELSYSWVTLLGNIGFVQDIHVPVFGSNNPLWSLAYEFWYYVLFPAVLATFKLKGWKVRTSSAALLLVSALIAGPNALILFPAWLAGAAVAAYGTQIAVFLKKLRPKTLTLARAASVVVTLGVMVGTHEIAMPGAMGAWVVAGAASVLVAVFLVDLQWTGRADRLLNAASNTAHYSYSFYAIHQPIIVLLCALIIPSADDRWVMTPITAGAGLLIVATAGVISLLFGSMTEMRTERVRKYIAERLSVGPTGLTR